MSAALLSFLLLVHEPVQQPRRVDGVAAIVNGEVISMSEVERAVRAPDAAAATAGCTGSRDEPAAFPSIVGSEAAEGPDAAPAAALRAAVLECLIDRALVYREVRRFARLDVPEAAIDAALAAALETRESTQEPTSTLVRTGRTVAGLRAELARQLRIDAYVDARFRATILVPEDDARALYTTELAPDMERRGIEPPAFEEVAEDFVIPILRERELNRRVQSWIADLRRRAVITRRDP